MDPVTLPEDVLGHPGVPEAGLMSEMNTRFQHLSHGHAGHLQFLIRSGYGLARFPGGNPARCPVRDRAEHPAASVETRGDCLPKKAALYTMKFPRKQRFTRSTLPLREGAEARWP